MRNRTAKRSHGDENQKSGTATAMIASSAYLSATVTRFLGKRSARKPA